MALSAAIEEDFDRKVHLSIGLPFLVQRITNRFKQQWVADIHERLSLYLIHYTKRFLTYLNAVFSSFASIPLNLSFAISHFSSSTTSSPLLSPIFYQKASHWNISLAYSFLVYCIVTQVDYSTYSIKFIQQFLHFNCPCYNFINFDSEPSPARPAWIIHQAMQWLQMFPQICSKLIA